MSEDARRLHYLEGLFAVLQLVYRITPLLPRAYLYNAFFFHAVDFRGQRGGFFSGSSARSSARVRSAAAGSASS